MEQQEIRKLLTLLWVINFVGFGLVALMPEPQISGAGGPFASMEQSVHDVWSFCRTMIKYVGVSAIGIAALFAWGWLVKTDLIDDEHEAETNDTSDPRKLSRLEIIRAKLKKNV